MNKPLDEGAHVVIVGGGLIGLGLGYELARSGRARVTVCERDEAGSGASGERRGCWRRRRR